MKFNRVHLIIFDSLGIGELPDAKSFGDCGSHTLKRCMERSQGLKIPCLQSLGIAYAAGISSCESQHQIRGYFGRMLEVSNGKDTTTGHWEMMGLPLTQGLSHFPNGFPADLMTEWSKRTGLGFLGNKPASGTQIIEELGDEHLRTGKAIVYTSADSVFQIAWHEEKYTLKRLYEICAITRKLLDESPYKVGRVIARPFVGSAKGSFKRTGNRRDFSLKPPQATALNALVDAGVKVVGVGKIPYIFDFQGISESLEAHNDREALDAHRRAIQNTKGPALIFTNLNDLDMLYGHRRDLEGYANHLEFLDQELSTILEQLKLDDLLLIAADHGNDPGFKGTDHTREYVPLIAYSPKWTQGDASSRRLRDCRSFSDIGKSLLENFEINASLPGESFLKALA